MIDNANQRFSFTIPRARDGSNYYSRWFLDKNYVEIGVDLEDNANNKIVFLYVL